MSKQYYLIKPFDVLFFRGNRAFDLGEWLTEGVFPPFSSTFQGLIRTAVLAAENGMIKDDGTLTDAKKAQELVGNDSRFPFDIQGPFVHDGTNLFLPTPFDLVKPDKEKNDWHAARLTKEPVQTDLSLVNAAHKSYALQFADEAPKTEYLRYNYPVINIELFNQYRNSGHLTVIPGNLAVPWGDEPHTGIKLDYVNGKKAEDQHYFLTSFVRLQEGAGLWCSVSRNDGQPEVPTPGQCGRLGSERRGVVFENGRSELEILKQPDYQKIARPDCFKVVLLTPGVFSGGWEPSADLYCPVALELYAAFSDAPHYISGVSQLGLGTSKYLKTQIRAVPAGSVFYYKTEASLSEDWLQKLDGTKIGIEPYRSMGFGHIAIAPITQEL